MNCKDLLFLRMKIRHSSFVKGTLPRLTGLKLALQLCFALQARACLFSPWKQLGVETHKKPALCEMQQEFVIFFQDSLPFLLFFPCFSHLFVMTIFSGWRPDLFSALSPICLLRNVNGAATSERARRSSPAWICASPWHTKELNTRVDSEKGICNWKKETREFYGYRGSYRKVFSSSLQPFLKEEINRVLKLRRAVFNDIFRGLQANSWLPNCRSLVLELLCF